MTNLTSVGLAILSLLAVWKFMLRPAIQDTFKDMLFDARDNLRLRFAKYGQLHTPAYCELRAMYNAYIRFIEVANLAQTFRFAYLLSKEPDVAERYSEEIDRRFNVDDPRLRRIVRVSRRHCGKVIQFYVFHSSFFSVAMLYLVAVPVAVANELFKFCRQRAGRSWRVLVRGVRDYIQAREDRALEPQHTEIFSQMKNLRVA